MSTRSLDVNVNSFYDTTTFYLTPYSYLDYDEDYTIYFEFEYDYGGYYDDFEISWDVYTELDPLLYSSAGGMSKMTTMSATTGENLSGSTVKAARTTTRQKTTANGYTAGQSRKSVAQTNAIRSRQKAMREAFGCRKNQTCVGRLAVRNAAEQKQNIAAMKKGEMKELMAAERKNAGENRDAMKLLAMQENGTQCEKFQERYQLKKSEKRSQAIQNGACGSSARKAKAARLMADAQKRMSAMAKAARARANKTANGKVSAKGVRQTDPNRDSIR